MFSLSRTSKLGARLPTELFVTLLLYEFITQFVRCRIVPLFDLALFPVGLP